jgi:hypothetical protein
MKIKFLSIHHDCVTCIVSTLKSNKKTILLINTHTRSFMWHFESIDILWMKFFSHAAAVIFQLLLLLLFPQIFIFIYKCYSSLFQEPIAYRYEIERMKSNSSRKLNTMFQVLFLVERNFFFFILRHVTKRAEKRGKFSAGLFNSEKYVHFFT